MKQIITSDKANKPFGYAQLDASGNLTGDVTASYALTASYVLNGGGGAAFPYTGSAEITGSLDVTGSLNLSGSQVYLTTDDFRVSSNPDIYGSPLLVVNNNTGVSIADTNFYGSIDAEGRFLQDAAAGIVSIDWNNRQLLKSDGTTVAFDWENGTIMSPTVTGSMIVITATPQNFPTASIDDIPGMVAFDKDYIYYCTQEFSTQGIVSHTYDVQGGIPWNAYHDPGTSWLQTGPSQENGGVLVPQFGWYFIDDTSVVRQLTSESVWFGPQPNYSPAANGSGWLCSVNSNDWVYSDSNPTLIMYESNPNQIIWKRTPWNAITNQVTGSLDITGSLTLNGASVVPYNTYTAMMSASLVQLTSGLLEVGNQYVIESLVGGDDFSNVGYVSDNTVFTATGTTPTNWTNGTVVTDLTNSQPSVNLFQDTIGVTVATEFINEPPAMPYYCFTFRKTNGFPEAKTWIVLTSVFNTNIYRASDDLITATGYFNGFNNILQVEFKVYN